jgi:hypothetical protein
MRAQPSSVIVTVCGVPAEPSVGIVLFWSAQLKVPPENTVSCTMAGPPVAAEGIARGITTARLDVMIVLRARSFYTSISIMIGWKCLQGEIGLKGGRASCGKGISPF